MARKLKTFVTSVGFFDLAVAAPSMKAALDAWGFRHNAFQQGFASQTKDEGIIAATMAKPGVVLRRPVGTNDPFQESAELPKGFAIPSVGKAGKTRQAPEPAAAGPKKPPVEKPTSRRAVISFQKEKAKRDRLRAREEAKQEQVRARRKRAVEKAESALAAAEARHRQSLEELERARAQADRRIAEEKQRWNKERTALEASRARAEQA